MLRPPPVIRPEFVSCRKLLLLLVFCAASMVMFFAAVMLRSLSLRTFEPLMAMSLPALISTVRPPKLLPSAVVLLRVSRVVTVELLMKPLLVCLCASS